MENKKTYTSEEKIEIIKEYMAEIGEPIKFNTIYKGLKIGDWKTRFRIKYRDGKLNISDELKMELQKYGVLPESSDKVKKQYTDKEKFEIFKEYLEKNDQVIKKSTKYKNYPIGVWKSCYRIKYRKGKMKEEDVNTLKEIRSF